jgi:hypothetical protein
MFCNSTLTAELLHDLEEELGVYAAQHHKEFEEVQRKSKLLMDATQVTKASDIHHIDIIYSKDNTAKKNE